MATVYIWGSAPHDHASLSFGNEYVSFHPKSTDRKFAEIFDGVESARTLLKEDYEHYGNPVKTFFLSGLNEEAMLGAYNEIGMNQQRYNFFLSNCSTVVLKILAAGAGSTMFDKGYANTGWSFQHGRDSVLEGINSSLERVFIMKSSQLQKRNPIAFSLLLLADLVQRQFIARPGDVAAFAEKCKGISI